MTHELAEPSILDGLNDEQLEAVTTTEGFVRVIAGAGSGKTRALSHRFAYLVNEIGILPGNILCVTFTNKAANEMRQRIHRLTGDNDTGYINTFHGFCVSVLQEDSNAVHYPKSFLVLDNSDIDAMLGIIYEERGLTLRDMTFSKARDMIEVRKLFTDPLYFRFMIDMSLDAVQQRYLEAQSAEDIIFYGYLYQEKKCFGLDYNDLIKFTLHVFEKNPDIRLKWQQRLEYIMIDEFQDIDALQYELMEVLCQHHRNLFVVGDPDQTIYTWRGANVKYLLEFDAKHPGTQTIVMNRNYRSTPQIVSVANSLISHNRMRMEKELVSQLDPGRMVLWHHARSAQEEALWMADLIQELHERGVDYRSMCVLYRAHYVTRSVEEAFAQRGVPYAIYSGVNFFDRLEVKDALCYLRMVAIADDLAFARVANRPKRNLGEKRMRFLREHAERDGLTLFETLCIHLDDPVMRGTKAHEFVTLVERYRGLAARMPVSELLAALLDESGYEEALRTEGSQERLDNLAELRQSVFEYETTCGEEATLENYLGHVALFSNLDADANSQKVKLMTVHAAKGLEFPHVFICGMNEGVFPSRKVKTLEAMEEERRLAFVAFTRAEETLCLTSADGWNLDGSIRYPSRFILDVDERLIERTVPVEDDVLNQARAFIAAQTRTMQATSAVARYKVGDRVRHKTFGEGSVTGVDDDRNAYTIQFDGMETQRSISYRVKLDSGGDA